MLNVTRSFSGSTAWLSVLALLTISPQAVAQYGGDPDNPVRGKLKPAAEFLADISDRPRRVIYTPYPVSAMHGVVAGFVHVSDGSAVLSRTDLVVDGVFPIVLRRAYHSLRTHDPDFGVGGWHLTIAERITRTSRGDYEYSYGNGTVLEFDRSGAFKSALQAHLSDVMAITLHGGGSVEIRTRTGLSKRFEKAGNAFLLMAVIDSYGNRLSFHYSRQGWLDRVDGGAGSWLKIGRDRQGRMAYARDSHGRMIAYRYDERGRLAGVKDPGEHEWLYGYDAENRLVTTTTPSDAMDTEFVYGEAGRVTQSRANGWRSTFAYKGLVTQVIDARGLSTSFTAAASGVTAQVTNAFGTTTAVQLDRDSLPTTLTRNGVSIAEFSYDELRYSPSSVRSVDQAGLEYRVSFDREGRVLKAVGAASGEIFRVENVGRGLQPERVVYASGASEVQFSSSGEITRFQKRDGKVLSFDRSASRLVVSNSAGQQATMEFDGPGRLVSAVTPYGHTLRFGYNNIGLRETTDTSRGARVRYWYDASGSLFSSSVGFQQWEYPSYTYVLGPDQRIDAVATGNGRLDRFIYNERGLLTNVQNGSSDLVRFEYDGLSRLRKVQYNGNQANEYEYSPGEPDIVAQLSYRALPVFNQQRESTDFASRFDTGLTRIRPAGMGLLTFNEMSGEIVLAADPTRWDPMAPISRSISALRLETLLEDERNGIQEFTYPANRFFVPREYWSVNCCICLCGPDDDPYDEQECQPA